MEGAVPWVEEAIRKSTTKLWSYLGETMDVHAAESQIPYLPKAADLSLAICCAYLWHLASGGVSLLDHLQSSVVSRAIDGI